MLEKVNDPRPLWQGVADESALAGLPRTEQQAGTPSAQGKKPL